MLHQKRVERFWHEEGLLPRPCLLHRLDKDTSGVAAIARTARACRHLAGQFYDHTIEKRYRAVVQKGAPAWAIPRTAFTVKQRFADGNEIVLGSSVELAALGNDELLLDGPLQRDPDERRRCIVGPDGQEAQTVINVLAREQQYFLLEVRPVTGRTHQIRAHLAALGYSIVGDTMYGVPAADEIEWLQRQFLHAYSLQLRRYPDNAECQFVAPLADDLVTWMKRYFPTALGVFDASTTVPD
jgi:23S rRNA-/tRNA-specific pseudouridylate synthase